MHEYTIDSGERRSITVILAVLGVLAAYALAQFLDATDLSIPWWLDAPAAFGFAALFYWIFDRYVWRWNWLRQVGFVRTPIVSGLWHGHMESKGAEQSESVEADFEVEQSWTSISIRMRGPSSRSFSVIAAITVKTPEPELVYVYRNEPHAVAAETMVPHYGTATHRLDRAGHTLAGDYYTGRGRMTFGAIQLERAKAT